MQKGRASGHRQAEVSPVNLLLQFIHLHIHVGDNIKRNEFSHGHVPLPWALAEGCHIWHSCRVHLHCEIVHRSMQASISWARLPWLQTCLFSWSPERACPARMHVLAKLRFRSHESGISTKILLMFLFLCICSHLPVLSCMMSQDCLDVQLCLSLSSHAQCHVHDSSYWSIQ